MSLTDEQNERLRVAIRRLKKDRYGDNATETADAIGVSQSLLSRFLSGKTGSSANVAIAVAGLLGVPVGELLGPASAKMLEARSPRPEESPTPPPVKSDTRRIASHYDDPEMEGYFASAIRHAADDLTGKQIVTGKVFLREKMTRMVDGIDMVDFALSVLEAVQALDREGKLGEPEDPATHTRILAWLAAQSRARRTPRRSRPAEPLLCAARTAPRHQCAGTISCPRG